VIKLDGKDNRSLPGYELRRSIGYAIQGHGLFPHRTVAQNIATVPVLLGWDSAAINPRVAELMTLYQLTRGLWPAYPHELSGGQQQRVGVARALAAEPNVLLMDEPFGALDPIIRTKAQEDLLAIQKRFGTTIILVTHDMEEASTWATRSPSWMPANWCNTRKPARDPGAARQRFRRNLVGASERPFGCSVARRCATPWSRDGRGEAIPGDASQRDALAELLWSGRPACRSGRRRQAARPLTVDGLVKRAARPA
jgi:osmoprotectant transport system ATP-binding protein